MSIPTQQNKTAREMILATWDVPFNRDMIGVPENEQSDSKVHEGTEKYNPIKLTESF